MQVVVLEIVSELCFRKNIFEALGVQALRRQFVPLGTWDSCKTIMLALGYGEGISGKKLTFIISEWRILLDFLLELKPIKHCRPFLQINLPCWSI